MKKYLILLVIFIVGCNGSSSEDKNTPNVGNTNKDFEISYINQSIIDLSINMGGDEPLVYRIDKQPKFGSALIKPLTGILTYLPDQTIITNEDDEIIVVASNSTFSAIMTISLSRVNHSPSFGITDKNQRVHYKQRLILPLNITDADNDQVNVEIKTPPAEGKAELIDFDTLVFTPEKNISKQTMELIATDGVNTQILQLNINIYNTPPQITTDNSSITASYKQKLIIPFKAVDADNDSFTLTLTAKPTHGRTSIKGSEIVYIPDGSSTGKQLITLQAQDEMSQTQLPIEVNLINHAPSVVTPISITKDIDDTINGIITATDSDEDRLTYSLKTTPKKGSVDLNSVTGEFIYTPNEKVALTDLFHVEVSDGVNKETVDINIKLTKLPLELTQKTYSSRTLRIEDKLIFSGASLVDFNTKIANPEDVESFTLDSRGNFTLIANPFAAPIKITVTASTANETSEAEMTFFTQQINSISDDSDPLYVHQWHLRNTGQAAFSDKGGTPGFDINIGQLHTQGVTGKDIEVAVVDTGLEIAHEDLVDNVIPNGSFDFVDKDTDPTPEFDNDDPAGGNGDHGTAVAGLIAAKGFNGLGGRGVAPDANLTGFNYLSDQSFEAWLATHGGEKTQHARIINQSYGYSAEKIISMNSSFDAQEAWLEEYYQTHPQPALMLKAAGNSFNSLSVFFGRLIRINTSSEEARLSHQLANSDPENASFYNTVVSALSADKNNARASYSTVGSAVMFSAPAGEYGTDSPAMITTDIMGCKNGYSKFSYLGVENMHDGGLDKYFQNLTQCSYTSQFNGTSSATPVASGVAALVMQANPKMTWRDVRYVMAKTATKIDTSFKPVVIDYYGKSFTADHGWVTNAAGNAYHNWYGFGLLNATKAVQMATRDYKLLPPLKTTDFIATNEPEEKTLIPENLEGLTYTFDVAENLKIEAIQLKLKLWHERMSDLKVELTSPSGTKSILMTPRHMAYLLVSGDLMFLSHAFLGENAKGKWTLSVVDTNDQKMSYINRFLGETEHTLENDVEYSHFRRGFIRIYGH